MSGEWCHLGGSSGLCGLLRQVSCASGGAGLVVTRSPLDFADSVAELRLEGRCE